MINGMFASYSKKFYEVRGLYIYVKDSDFVVDTLSI